MAQQLSLTVEGRLERLGEIAEFVGNAARASGLDEKQIYDVQMAVDEACSNVMEHAYQGRQIGTIDIQCETHGKEFVVTVRDFGKPFDPKKVSRPNTKAPLSERSIGGLGLFFMYKLMDRVEFDFSRKHGNRVIMAKKIKK